MAWQIQCTASSPPASPPPFTPKCLPPRSLFFTLSATSSSRFCPHHMPSLRSVTCSLSAVESPTSTAGLDDSKTPLLEVKGLTAVIAETKQEILKGVNLVVHQGEIHAIMGKNGSGKSTFSKVLVGHPDYEVTGGSVVFKGENLLDMEPEERSLAGLFMSFQAPIEIPGVNNIDFLHMAYNARRKKLGELELGPLEVLGADLAILDEIDSGLDIDALRDVAKAVNGLLTPKNSVMMITHYRRLLEVIKPTCIHIMEDGRIIKTGDSSLAKVLEEKGYTSISAE
ncbi:PREDICTED: ABC transporter I family member 6, chloroplastic isoform X2 [Theobroma cacao]|uniref:ABC transporter I family member 6, chloroplastic isoform X2 n=1 Tax=Theobroma cacao TaxID=3641 RepID=A0AB32X3L5_THECC|nr:PREDICTED: ABC transporter I family member 6, chloroplastic isoform X2 [Theobroma cacao]